MLPSPSSLSERIKQEAYNLGFSRVGIARAEPLDGRHLRQWLETGCHGSMAYMADHLEMRLDPGLLMPGARSVLVAAVNYFAADPDFATGTGIIARYARGDDYHRVLRTKLQKLLQRIHELAPEASGRICVDSTPIHEKSWAVRAGIGWQGKNSLIIAPGIGSWIVLCELVLDLELEPDRPVAADCGSCRNCIEACPTGALAAPGWVDPRRCLAYHTIEQPAAGPIPDKIAARLGQRIFGCDICQEVCPRNRRWSSPGGEPRFSTRPWSVNIPLSRYAGMTEEEFNAAFAGSAIIRAKHAGFLRSVAAAL